MMPDHDSLEVTYVLQDIPETVPVGTVVAEFKIVGPDADVLTASVLVQYALVDVGGMAGLYEDFHASPFRIEGNQLVTAQELNYGQYGFDGFFYRVFLATLRDSGAVDSMADLNFDVLDQLDYISGTSGNDRLRGDVGADKLVGESGNDFLSTLRGNDILYGGKGQDILVGGLDHDTFLFKSVLESNLKNFDTINDWESVDTIDLTGVDANTRTTGNQEFIWLTTKIFTGKAGELRYEKHDGDTFVYGDVNGDRKADLLIHLEGEHSLFKADFEL